MALIDCDELTIVLNVFKGEIGFKYFYLHTHTQNQIDYNQRVQTVILNAFNSYFLSLFTFVSKFFEHRIMHPY